MASNNVQCSNKHTGSIVHSDIIAMRLTLASTSFHSNYFNLKESKKTEFFVYIFSQPSAIQMGGVAID